MNARDESGFTLIELLIGIAILGAVTAALASAVIVGFHTTDGTTARLALSHDAQLASAYFVTDVQTADDVPTAAVPCITDSGTVLLRLHWLPRQNPTGSPPVETQADKYVTYDLVPGTGGVNTIVRQYCQVGGGYTSVVVAHNIDASKPAPLPTCTTLGTPSSCTGSPTTIQIAGQEVWPSKVNGQSVTYSFSLAATRRSTP